MPFRLVFALVVFAAASPASAQPARPPSGDLFGALAPEAPRGAVPGLPAGFYIEPAMAGLDTPVAVAFAPDGRLFAVEKGGRVVVREGGQQRVLLDLRGETLDHADRGMLGVAVDPGFAQNGRIYLVYTVSTDGQDSEHFDAFGRVTRYTLGPDGEVVTGSRRVLVGATYATGIPACYYSHSVGTLAFGRDGTLLVGTGDAASYNTVDTGGLYPACFGAGRFPASEDVGAFRSQRLQSLAGKILRLDPETGQGLPSNPFWTGNADDAASKVWALGFRNPFRFSVDPATGSESPADGDPGVVHYGDVGWDRWEEVGVVRRGQNFGWPCREGAAAQTQSGSYPNTPRGQQVCPGLTATPPTFQWHHDDAAQSVPAGRRGASVVGGAVYRGMRYPAEYRGRFFYGDYAQGWLASAGVAADGTLSGDALFSADTGPVVDVAYDAGTQSLALVDVVAGTVARLRHTDGDVNAAPVAVASGTPTSGVAPLAVQFSSAGTADPDGDALSYSWVSGAGEASTAVDPGFAYPTPGSYTARLTVTDARGATATADVPISVRAAGGPPVAAITQPGPGASVLAGQTLALAAAATDPDAGQTETLQYAWAITLVHDGHQHPGAFAATGPMAAYTVPFHGDAGESYALAIRLTVTDATGLQTTAERTVAIGASGGEADVTAAGTPVALVMAPVGAGSHDIATVHDGVAPAPTTSPTPSDALLQYDTYTGDTGRLTDWVGYTFDGPRRLVRVQFHEGLHFNDGGWFETLGVEVRQGGAWVPVQGLAVEPAYGGSDGRHFDAYGLSFAPIDADGVRVVGRPGGSSRFVSVSELRVFAATTLGPLPEGWTGVDVGPVYGAGSSGYADGAFTVRGGGDIWGTLDHFHFVWRPLAGDGTITARLAGLAGAHPWAKAGLMVRAGLDGDAAHAMLIGTAGEGVHLQYRAAAGAETAWTPGPAQTLPAWLRLSRVGPVVSALVSADGQSWTPVGQATVALGESVLVGLVATSTDHDGRNDVATATFTDVAPPGPVAAEPGAAAPTFAVASVSPNPARGLVRVRLGIAEAGVYHVDLVDVLGRRTFEATLREGGPVVRDLPVDLRGHSTGVYVVRVRQEGGAVVTGRVTVVR